MSQTLSKRYSARDYITLSIISIPLLILVYAFFNESEKQTKPKAIKGHLDLNGVLLNETVPLNGEWKFYWKELFSPSDFDSSQPKQDQYITVPGLWNNFSTSTEKAGAHGYATYVLNVTVPEAGRAYSLYTHTVSNAYKLWLNDSLIASNGTVGKDKNHTVPEYKPHLVSFMPKQKNIRLVMQISNFDHCKGGFWLPIEIGEPLAIQRQRDTRSLLEMFLFGSLFIMALYHFSLYLLRRNDSSTLYFGMMCAIIGFRSLLTGENLVNFIIPEFNWFAARKIEYILTFLTVPAYLSFVRILYPGMIKRNFCRFFVWAGLTMAVFVLFTPSHIYTYSSFVFTIYVWIASIYIVSIFIRASRKKKGGAIILLFTSLFFFVTIINDTLNQLELIHTGLYLSLGLFVVTFAQSFILSDRFSNAFYTSEIYARTFQKFVPVQFLSKIAKEGIESIKAGNAERSEASVLFSDIRSFTSISETLTATEVFEMLNQYLSYVEPPIRINHGFVDKYMGDGIMALFENGTDGRGASYSIEAALQMQTELNRFNEKRLENKLPALKMGIGIHTGSVIMGTLGGNERMDSTAIGDAVNLASRIEGMTKMYGLTLLISDETRSSLVDSSIYHIRFIDKVTAKGKTEPVSIWELLGKKIDKSLDDLNEFIPAYEKGINAYRTKEYELAISIFEHCLKMKPNDEVSKIYLKRCEDKLTQGNNIDEDGITHLDEK
jgi:adenylate cyclase